MDPTEAPAVHVVERPLGHGRTRAEYRWLAAGVGATDALSLLLSFTVAYVVRFGFISPASSAFDVVAVTMLATPCWLAVFAVFRLYAFARLAPTEEVRRLFWAVTAGITGIVTASYWTKAELSRQWVGTSWVLCLLLLLVTRRLWRAVSARSRAKGMLTFRTVIVGTNSEAAHLAAVMDAGGTGFDVVGFARVTSDGSSGSNLSTDLPIGDLAQIRALVVATDADCLYVASSAVGTGDLRSVTRLAREDGVEVRVSSNLPEMMPTRLAPQPLGGLMGFSLWPVRLSGSQAVIKRTFDLVAAAALLVLISPVFLAIVLAIRLTSPGSAFFRQTRVGRSRQPFVLLKFRTMVRDAPERPLPPNEGASPLFKARIDPRITRVGRFLRRWSLDELPQLVNVVRGDMSLVGPRPPLPAEVASFADWHLDRFEVRPGITGPWQVSGRSELSFDDYVRLDLFYIENWSLAYDVYLLAKTLPAVASGRGAY